jgi:hypothetical protein
LIDVLRQAGVERVYGVVGDNLNLHRFVRRQFAIYSVRGHASAGSNRLPSERTLTMGTARNACRPQDYTAVGIATIDRASPTVPDVRDPTIAGQGSAPAQRPEPSVRHRLLARACTRLPGVA